MLKVGIKRVTWFFCRKAGPESAPVTAAVAYLTRPLGPEAILCLLVTLEFAELGDFFIRKPPYMHLRERCGAAVSLRLHGHEHDYNIFFGKDMMNLDSKGTPAQFHRVFEKSDDLVVPLVIARQRTMTRHMPGDRCVECLKDRGVVIRLTDTKPYAADFVPFSLTINRMRIAVVSSSQRIFE